MSGHPVKIVLAVHDPFKVICMFLFILAFKRLSVTKDKFDRVN